MHLINDNNQRSFYVKKYSLESFFSKTPIDNMYLYKYETGDYICRSDQMSDSLIFLVQGKCRISQIFGNGKSILLRFATPPFIFGDIEYVLKESYQCDCQCIEDCLLISIPYSYLTYNCQSDSVFWKTISQNLAIKMQISTVTNSINILYPLENRLASYLIATSKFNHTGNAVTDMFTSKLSDIADLLGTTYRHLARTLNTLSEKGIISRNGRKIVIEDLEALRDLAGDIYI